MAARTSRPAPIAAALDPLTETRGTLGTAKPSSRRAFAWTCRLARRQCRTRPARAGRVLPRLEQLECLERRRARLVHPSGGDEDVREVEHRSRAGDVVVRP